VRATCATAGTDCANSGPRMISAPSSTPAARPAARPAGVPVVLDQELDVRILEFGQRHLGGVLHRLRGEPALPAAESGRIRPTLTRRCQRSRLLRRPAVPARRRAERIGELAEALLHAGAGRRAAARRAAAKRAPPGRARRLGPGRSLGLTRAQHAALFLTTVLGPVRTHLRKTRRIQAYCRQIVNQNKRLMTLTAALRLARRRPLANAMFPPPIWRKRQSPLAKIVIMRAKPPR
jgi:hypothetical protein